MSWKRICPPVVKPVRTRTRAAVRRTAWNVSSSVSTSRHGRPVRSAMNASSGSNFGFCLPPNAAAGVRGEHAHLGSAAARIAQP